MSAAQDSRPSLIEKVAEPWQSTVLDGVVKLLVDSTPGVVCMTTVDGFEVRVTVEIAEARRA